MQVDCWPRTMVRPRAGAGRKNAVTLLSATYKLRARSRNPRPSTSSFPLRLCAIDFVLIHCSGDVMKIGDKYRSTVPIPVTCIWENDCLAGEYATPATLPQGEEFTVVHLRTEADAPIQCVPLRQRRLVRSMIPRHMRMKFLGLCLPTEFEILVARLDLQEKCEQIEPEQAR